jgi:hypothetical protein
MLEVFAVTAPEDEIAAKVHAKYAGILDRVAFYVPFQAGVDVERWKRIVATFH